MFVYDVIKHREKANTYVVYARFKDEDAFNHHMGIDFHDRLVPPILECLDEEMQARILRSHRVDKKGASLRRLSSVDRYPLRRRVARRPELRFSK